MDIVLSAEDRKREREFMQEWMDKVIDGEVSAFDSVYETVDGCRVEADGKCPHGFSAPPLYHGMV